MSRECNADSHDGKMTQIRILFFGPGNTAGWRLALGAMRQLIAEEDRLDDFLLGSAALPFGDGGSTLDARMHNAAARHGIDTAAMGWRQIGPDDFRAFDLMLAMDKSSRDRLAATAPPGNRHKIHLLLDFSPWIGAEEISEPAAGDEVAFDDMVDLAVLGLRGLIEAIDQAKGALDVPFAARARLKVSSAT